MESFHSFATAHRDHDPPVTRPPATLSPSDGEREGVRGRFIGEGRGEGERFSFMAVLL